MMAKIPLLLSLIILFGNSMVHAQPSPTASEIFELRSKCHVLSEELMNRMKKEIDLQNPQGHVHFSEKSHYSISKNICYSNISSSFDKSLIDEVYDAQSTEKLADVEYFGIGRPPISGYIKGSPSFEGEKAADFIKSLMESE